MLLLILILLSNCNKLNFSKESKFCSMGKPNIHGTDDEDKDKKRVSYVIKEEDEPKHLMDIIEADIEQKEELKFKADYSDVKYSKTGSLPLMEVEEKARQKAEKENLEKGKVKLDYSDVKYSKTDILPLMEVEEKARQKAEKERERLEERRQSSSYSNECNLQYGYERTISGSSENFYCG